VRVSLIIPTLDGLTLLQKHLPALLRAEGVADAELIIADDGSTDGTGEWLRANVPQAKVVRRETNGGFSRACNAAISASTGNILVLLNNDVEVDPNFLPPLLGALESAPSVFAVNSSILLPGQDMLDEGEKTGGFHNGIFYVDCRRDPATRSTETAPALYATACSAAYRRAMVEQIGGFDELYSPCYWEDVDLSYRALKRGWQVLYEPQSIVYHQHETTTARMDPRFTAMIKHRNSFVFVWKNIADPRWTASSILLTPFVALYRRLRDGEPSVLAGWLAALRLWPQIASRRAQEKRESRVTDRQILGRFAAQKPLPALSAPLPETERM
jgi:GT2 family glycosyltransferase